ncbi:MAG: hypothetical protein R3F19_11790 [Verrucomicrobiales bacterium]
MPVSTIAQILLRLFALNWMLSGLIQIISAASQWEWFSISSLAMPVLYIVAGATIWYFAPSISRLIARGSDGEFNLQGVTERQLFATAFVSLGLYFALNSFGNAFNWIHYFAMSEGPDEGGRQTQTQEGSFYVLTYELLTLAAGIYLIATARMWAAKLTREKSGPTHIPDESPPAPTADLEQADLDGQ